MYKTGIHTMFQGNWLNYGVGGLPIADRKGLKFCKEYILKSLEVKVKQSCYRPGVAQRVPGISGSQIS